MPDSQQAEREAALEAILNVQDAPFTCGCHYDSGPYRVPCGAHDEDALVDAARAAGRGEAAERIEALADRWELQQANYAGNAAPGDRDAALAAAAAVRICARELRALLSEGAECA